MVIIGEPSVEVDVIVREQAVHVRAAHVLFVQIEHRDVGIVFKDHAGDDLVAELEVFARAVFLDVLTHLDDLARPFMAENDRDQVERIALEFMCIGAANAAAFHFYEDIVIPDLGQRIFADLVFFLFDEHCDARFLRDRGARSRRSRCRRSSGAL